jgi:hypothetical protein
MKLSVVLSYLGVLCIFAEGLWLGGLIFTGSFNEFLFGLAVGQLIWLFSIELFVDDAPQEIRAKIRELQAKLERLQKEEVPPPP